MTTVTEVADRAQSALNDAGAGTWAQATVEEWVQDAINDYGHTFPRITTQAYDWNEDQTVYEFALPTDFIAAIRVEYPDGQDPPTFLTRRACTHPQFYGYEGYYDIRPSFSAATAGLLILSEHPSSGEGMTLTYLTHHPDTFGNEDDITVPSDHEPLLILYTVWRAFTERVATHEPDPDTTKDFMSALVKAEQQAEQAYTRALDRARADRSDGGSSGPWRMDLYDRIY